MSHSPLSDKPSITRSHPGSTPIWRFTAATCCVVLCACSPKNDPLVVLPIDPKPNAPLLMNIASDSHTYSFILATGNPVTSFDSEVAAQDLKPLTSAEQAAQGQEAEPSPEGGIPRDYHRPTTMHSGQWTIPVEPTVPSIDYRPLAEHLGAPVDGMLGIPAVATLNWLWNRGAGTMSGYRFDSSFFARSREKMICTAMETLGRGVPAIQLDLGGEPVWFALDTSITGRLSGDLSSSRIASLRAQHAIAAEVSFSPNAPAGQSWTHALIQPKSISLAGVRIDGLAFDEVDDLSHLGMGFLYKFDQIAFDFANHRFCFPATTRVHPDQLPSQAELKRLAESSNRQ